MASTSMIVTSSRTIKKLFPYLYSFTSSSSACFSTAYERAESSNAVNEAREGGEGGGTSGLSYTPKESVKEGLYEAKHQGLSMPNDGARDGPVKVAEKADLSERQPRWKAAQETTRKIKDEAAGNNRRQVTDHQMMMMTTRKIKDEAAGNNKRQVTDHHEAGLNRIDDHDRDRDTSSSDDEDPNVRDLRRCTDGYDKEIR